MKTAKLMVLLGMSLSLTFCAATNGKKKAPDPEKDPQYQFEKAVVAMNYGLADAAVNYLNLAVSLDPAHYESWNLLGRVYAKKQNFEDAVSAYQKCLELRPDLSDTRNNLGFVYKEMGRLDKAEEEFKKAFSMDGNPNAGFNLANLYFEQNKLDEALESIRKSIRKKSDLASFHNLEGVILNRMKQYAEAVESFENALLLSPDDLYMNINLGIAHFNNEEFEEARKIFEKILPRIQDETLKKRIAEYLKMIKD